MNENEKKVAIEALKEAGATMPCPRCGKKEFTLIDGYVPLSVHTSTESFGSLIAGGPTVPCLAVACTHCGFIALHALGVLKLLPVARQPEEQGGHHG